MVSLKVLSVVFKGLFGYGHGMSPAGHSLCRDNSSPLDLHSALDRRSAVTVR